jgi:hypothetical protein
MRTAPSLSVLSRLDAGTQFAWANRPSICTHTCTSEIMDTYTIIQRNEYDSWRTLDVVHDLTEACALAAHYCSSNGVARTLVLDYLGSCVCLES